MNYLNRYIAYVKDNPKEYWFKRKLFGWGWTPVTWQGWLATALFVGLIVWNATRIDGVSHSANDTLINFIPQTILLVVILIAICYKTGEPPKWQWGIPDEEQELDNQNHMLDEH